jgi:hypothetical protein
MASKKTGVSVAGVSAGIAALAAAAAAGGYFLYGKDGAKNRKKIKGWMLKAKGEVLDQMEKGKEVTEETYHNVIDKVSAKYQSVKDIDPAELQQMVKELKSHWKSIKAQLSPKPKANKKAVKK